ncbi:hypothetical protein AOA57_30885 [Pseudomonas sp. 2588-5]|nr:hypothetical protein AOA57_30885 [Pseudomonas sp. 2588-5]
MGLYWEGANKYGAITSMLTGIISYACIHNLYPHMLGVHTVVFPVIFSFMTFIIASWLGKEKELRPLKSA